jgi:broad specificity phosphatase PhoE
VEILLVRHGESVGNAQERLQGQTDFPLTDYGRAQARLLGLWLVGRGAVWDHVYVSPLTRARQTAEILNGILGGTEPVVEPALAEIAAGEIEGFTFDEICARFPHYPERRIDELGDFAEFGGESYEDVQRRARSLRQRLEASHFEPPQRVLLVGHGGFNFQLLKLFICEPVPRVCIVKMGNCSASLVRVRRRRNLVIGDLVWHVPVELMGASEREGRPL